MSKNKIPISFSPKQLVKELFAVLSARGRDVLKKRFGLDKKDKITLEAVGEIYGITRERVRQIEEFSLAALKKHQNFALAAPALEELEALMEERGGVVHEQEFLQSLSDDKVAQNHLHLLLVLGDAFTKLREDDSFHHRWTTDSELAEAVHRSLKNLCQALNEDELVAEDDLVETFLTKADPALSHRLSRERAKHWLRLCKEVGQSPIGQWGLTRSANVSVRGVRDYAYLVMRRDKKPLHFVEVAKQISQTFNRRVNTATTHNELIKDPRFVLVGRGLYALAEWGHTAGIVREVIERLLNQNGPLTQEEVIALVLKERQVKPNTIAVNLHDHRFFKQDAAGRFVPAAR